MKLTTSDKIKVVIRIFMPFVAIFLSGTAWGPWWFLWSTLIIIASYILGIYLRKKNSENTLNPVIAIDLPAGLLSAVAVYSLSNANPLIASLPLANIYLPLIWVTVTIFAITNLSHSRS